MGLPAFLSVWEENASHQVSIFIGASALLYVAFSNLSPCLYPFSRLLFNTCALLDNTKAARLKINTDLFIML